MQSAHDVALAELDGHAKREADAVQEAEEQRSVREAWRKWRDANTDAVHHCVGGRDPIALSCDRSSGCKS